jgi:hypothetical protein
MVDDIETSRDELTRVLGVNWTAVLARGEGSLSVCMTTERPPYLELIQARVGSDLAWRPSPKFDHLTHWVDDLAGESERLQAIGVPLRAGNALRDPLSPRSQIRPSARADSRQLPGRGPVTLGH